MRYKPYERTVAAIDSIKTLSTLICWRSYYRDLVWYAKPCERAIAVTHVNAAATWLCQSQRDIIATNPVSSLMR